MAGKTISVAVFAWLALSASAQRHAVPAPRIQPESFYLAVSDEGSWRILDVQPASPVDALVREIIIYPACGTYHVREENYTMANVSVADLSRKIDLCAAPETLSKIVHLLAEKQPESEFWSGGVGIVSQCGTEKIIHQLPARDSLRFDVLTKRSPQLAALWSLSAEIRKRIDIEIGGNENSLPQRNPNQYDHDLASAAAIEIRSGKFDLAFPDLPNHLRVNGRQKVSDLIPNPDEAASPEEDHGEVKNVERLGLEKMESIAYPQMARIAHIIGDVAMTIRIDHASGTVISATFSSGHPILQAAARDATRNWVFTHPYFGPDPLDVIVHFQLRCPPIIETQSSSVSIKVKKRHRKKKPALSPPTRN
jgi:hypothetical protein